MYCIKISYETGDSFNNYDEERILDLTWENLDIAKENLKRIREHHEWYENTHGWSARYGDKKSKQRPKFVPKKYDFCIELITDKQKTVQISAFWVGYFETLYGAEIIEQPYSDPDMIYNPRGY